MPEADRTLERIMTPEEKDRVSAIVIYGLQIATHLSQLLTD